MIKHFVPLFTVASIFGVMVDGYSTRPGQFPYQVSIQTPFHTHFCSGAIIAPKWVLTSADCYFDEAFVVAGIIKLNATNPHRQERKVLDFYLHPDFDRFDMPSNDIALAHLNEALVYNKYVNQVELPNEWFTSTDTPIVSGWVKDILQFTPAPSVSEEVCKKEYPEHIPVKQECYGPIRQGCLGFHGDPIVQEGTIIGVASYSKVWECDTKYPKIYTNVVMYLDFIYEYIRI